MERFIPKKKLSKKARRKLDRAGRQAVEALCTVKTSGVTGVEMEALTGVSTALLTIYDMCKAVDKGMELGEIHLVEKTGGKSGHYIRAEGGYV